MAIEFVVLIVSLNTFPSDFFSMHFLLLYRSRSDVTQWTKKVCDIKCNKGKLVLGHIVENDDINRTEDIQCIVNCSNEICEKAKSRKWSQCAYAWRHLTHVPVFARVNDDTRRKWNEKRPSTQLVRSGRVPKHK